jgi:virginiamycin B lyase
MSLLGGSRQSKVVVLALAAVMASAGCGGSGTAPTVAGSCKSIQRVSPVAVTAAPDGLQLPTGSGAVGLTLAPDGAVWFLATGNNRVYRITPAFRAEYWQLPASELGFQLSIAQDGTAWIPEQYRDAIASISPSGAMSECHLAGGAQPTMALALPDGTVWVAENGGNGLARLSQGRFKQMALPPPNRGVTEMAPDGAGGVWATESKADALVHANSSGLLTEVSLNHDGATPLGILAARDGSIWVAEFAGSRIDHVGPGDKRTSFPLADGSAPQGLAEAADGSLWFTESKADRIGMITPKGEIALKLDRPAGAWPDHIAIAPDGALWWTEYYAERVVRLPAPTT